jgi:4-amino-4-deoxy-L-arabinose transferase-like glycosyltransferase
MRSPAFIVTPYEARRLPGLVLFLVVALYVLAGLWGRDPWGRADAEGFGVALTMARGGLTDWLAPNVFGLPITEEGPLPGWLGAAAILLLGSVLGEPNAARLASGLVTAAGLLAIWLATGRLATRPEIQPTDPFEVSASARDIGRAVADAALLVCVATCGLIARVHESSAIAFQFAWLAAFAWGAALAIERPVGGGLIAGFAIAASALTRGLPVAVALMAVIILLPWVSQRYRLVGGAMLTATAAALAVLTLPWPMALLTQHPEGAEWLRAWLGWNAAEVGSGSLRSLVFLARNLPWYLWPAWPLALWAIWQWRKQWRSPSLALPLLMALAALALMLITPSPTESMMLPTVVPFAILTALALPVVKRGLVSLLDWIAVATFSLIGVVIWAYWIALLTGFPPRMADSAARLAPGFVSDTLLLQAGAGLIASLAWLALVGWRTARRPRAIWRPMALSSGGLLLAWVLLIALWLPAYDARVSYRGVAREIARALGSHDGCIRGEPLDAGQRASLAYFGNLRFNQPGERCDWLLMRDDARAPIALPSKQWRQVWQGRRPFDNTERFVLYRREP